MFALIALAISAFTLSLILTPSVRGFALRQGLVDHPDTHRKLHAHPIPRVGGVAIALAFAGSFAILWILPGSNSAFTLTNFSLVIKVTPAVLVVFLAGLIDDLWGLRPWQKLLAQVIAAQIVFFAGIRFTGIAGASFEQWWIGLPLTTAWLVICTNAFNLIDGVDGLATGVGLFATLTMLAAGMMSGHVSLAIATVPLAGALLGFLRYNFNPATIFLGDSGSLLIGFLLGCYGLVWSQKAATILGLTAPLMALAVPLLDTALAIVRRYLRKKPIFGADRAHIHHRLLDRGLTPRRVALIMYGFAGIFAGLSLLTSTVQGHFTGVVLILFCIVAWIGIQNLGYVEINLASQLLLGGAFRNMLDAQLSLRGVEESLESAETLDDVWLVVSEACKMMGFCWARLEVRGFVWEDKAESSSPDTWQIVIPIRTGTLTLGRLVEEKSHPTAVAHFADVLYDCLDRKFEKLLVPKVAAASAAAAGSVSDISIAS